MIPAPGQMVTRFGRLVTAGSLVLLLVAAVGCAPERPVAPVLADSLDPSPTISSPFGEIRLTALQTYDGSGQTVHPDFVRPGAGWAGAGELLAITPYPNSTRALENPMLFSRVGKSWLVAPGTPNPLVTPATGYLSDPDAVHDPETGELVVYYRQVAGGNLIHAIRSRDGITWSPPITVVSGASHTIVSPTVVRRAPGDWMMWSVNAGEGCSEATTTVELRRSSDGITWGSPVPVSISQRGYSAWHIDVQWIPERGEFWAVYNIKPRGTCSTAVIALSTSPDGITWTMQSAPVLTIGAIPEFEHIVYRSTFYYHAATDAVTFWYSGARWDGQAYVWRSARQRVRREQLFASGEMAGMGMASDSIAGPPPLMDPP